MLWHCINFRIRDERDSVVALLQHRSSERQLVARLFLDRRSDKGISSQLLDYFDKLSIGPKEGRAFPATETLRRGISSIVSNLWEDLGVDESAASSDSVLNLYEEFGVVRGNLEFDKEGFRCFISHLQKLSELGQHQAKEPQETNQTNEVAQFSVIFESPLASRRSPCLISQLPHLPQQQFVFKGITFADYLAFDADVFRCRKDAIYREIQLLCNVMPHHPNVMPRPTWFVILPDPENLESPKVLGVLYPYYKNSTMSSVIERSVEEGSRISLHRKAKWCFQLADALYHVHYRGHTWHQDMKPANILLDDEDNVVIIDWEQGIGGTNTFVSPVETDGSFDLEVISRDGGEGDSLPMLHYIPYTGPVRINNVIGTPHWDVFRHWHSISRLAVEVAEIFSLGFTIFILLEEVSRGDKPDVEDYTEARREWTECSTDIPQRWKENVNACIKDDPNERPTLLEQREFWDRELKLFNGM